MKSVSGGLTGHVRRQIVGAVVDLIGFGPRHENVVESAHPFETVAHVVVERRQQVVVAEIRSVDVLLVERRLRRLGSKKNKK